MPLPDEVTIRDARDDERGAIRALTLRAYSELATVMEPVAWEELRQALLRGQAYEGDVERIVAEHRGALVGSVMLFPAEADAYEGAVAGPGAPELRMLAVEPGARGLGVGRALVDECVRRARAAGAAELGLHTSRSMRVAIGMYERMGFVRAPEHDFQPEGAELVLGYRLRLE